MPSFETLLWEQDAHVLTITMNRPQKKNAMSWTMFEELRQAFDDAGADDSVRCVVITGAGGAFCTGADLTDAENAVGSAAAVRQRMKTVGDVARAVIECPKPTIAKVTGIAAGAGCNLAFGCDFIVATSEAAFAEIFVKRGLVVDFGGTWALTRLLPLTRAKELALLGDVVSAAELDRWGVLNRFCEPDEVEKVTGELATRLAALPPLTVTQIKDALNRGADRSLEENLDVEGAGQALAFTTEDTREAVLAFVEKRAPAFKGR